MMVLIHAWDKTVSDVVQASVENYLQSSFHLHKCTQGEVVWLD